ncbi:MAG: RNA polymerase sigma factor SigF [Candidatus Nanopelagicales bacterium]
MSDPPATSRWGPAHRARERVLLAELAALPDGDPRRAPVRDELVTMHLPLVRHLAGRYRDRGEPWEDLVQVGTVGLIKAVDRFDVDRGVEFSTFATPTILGEIKRNFRDRSWALKVPRRLQDLQAQVTSRAEELTASLGRAPTVRELASAIDVPEADVLDALEARHAYAADSLDATLPGDDSGGTVAASIGADDPAFLAVEDREALRPLLAALPDRERRIVMLRFFERKTQSQIAEQLGISQMHVSRLLARTLAQLRAGLEPAR